MNSKRISPSPELREEILERDNHTCRYCGSKKRPFHIDHVYPVSKGGITTGPNLVTACRKCNGRKSNKIGFWPNPSDMEDQKRRAIEEHNSIAGYLIVLLGLNIILVGFVWSKLFALDFDGFLWVGIIVSGLGTLYGIVENDHVEN